MKEITVSDMTNGSLSENVRMIFRGENKEYKYRIPTIYRDHIGRENYDEIIEGEFKKIQEIGMQVYDDLVAKKIKHHLGFCFHNGKVIGDSLISGYIAPGATRFYLQILSLLQHYGMRTQFLDVTFDPLIALYFACYSHDDRDFFNDGYGFIYRWNPYELNDTDNNDFLCFDLEEVATFFINENVSNLTRPKTQKAASLCISSWLFPLWEDRIDCYLNLFRKKTTCYCIDRSKIDYSIFKGFDPYPSEPLFELLSKYIKN